MNWVRTNYENVYKCQGTQIKTEPDLLRLLPRTGKFIQVFSSLNYIVLFILFEFGFKTGEFMATYIYARPSLRPLIGDLISDPLISRITNAYVVFTFSQDQKTGLNLFLWRKGQNKYDELIWSNTAHHPTNGVVKVKVPLKNLTDKFRLLFQAHVTANYQYTFRTYLSQVIIDKVKLKSD